MMISALKRLKGNLRSRAKGSLSVSLRLLGTSLLSKQASDEFLSAHASDQSEHVCVLRPGPDISSLEILRAGGVRVNRSIVLDIDYGNYAAIFNFRPRHHHRSVDLAVVLWSHFWTGYYHWTIDVLPKICVIQQYYGDRKRDLSYCYPVFGTSFEAETLELLGIDSHQVIDTRSYGSLMADEVAVVPLPGWYQIHPGISLVRDRLIEAGSGSLGPRIYVSRSGTRACANEDQILPILSDYGFVFMEDRPRSVREQIGIFRDASVVIGPHGAALSNLIWCTPGTRVIELLAPTYRPPYYKNLCAVMGLKYKCLVSSNSSNSKEHWTSTKDPVVVNPSELRAVLDSLSSN